MLAREDTVLDARNSGSLWSAEFIHIHKWDVSYNDIKDCGSGFHRPWKCINYLKVVVRDAVSLTRIILVLVSHFSSEHLKVLYKGRESDKSNVPWERAAEIYKTAYDRAPCEKSKLSWSGVRGNWNLTSQL